MRSIIEKTRFLPFWFFKSPFAKKSKKKKEKRARLTASPFKKKWIHIVSENTRWAFHGSGIFRCPVSSSLPIHLSASELFVLAPAASLVLSGVLLSCSSVFCRNLHCCWKDRYSSNPAPNLRTPRVSPFLSCWESYRSFSPNFCHNVLHPWIPQLGK